MRRSFDRMGSVSLVSILALVSLRSPVGADFLARDPVADSCLRLKTPGAPGGRVLARRNGLVLTELTPAERRRAVDTRRVLGRRTDGGGGDVSGLEALQVHFLDSACPSPCGEPCNVVFLLWTEATLHASVSVFVDGAELGEVPGLPAPGTNGATVLAVEAGSRAFRIEANDGTSATAILTVLDAQPFADPQLVCEEGSVDDVGTCEFVVTVENPGPRPTSYGLFLDEAFLGAADGNAARLVVSEVPAGEHCAEVVGLLESATGTYRGCYVETCCVLNCADVPCAPPMDLLVCQASYGPEAADNAVLALWTNGEPAYATGVIRLVDGETVGTLPTDPVDGSPTGAVFDDLSPGTHTIGVQGDCDTDGLSTVTDTTFEVLAASPHPNPTRGTVGCVWSDVDGGTTTATWVNDEPSVFIDVYVFNGQNFFFLGTADGNTQTVTVTGTAPTDVIVLQFFANVGGSCYGSELVGCLFDSGATPFVRSDANADGATDIADGIFTLGFLFLGGPPPTCRSAADSNADGALNIADGIHVFSFLFLGGPPPPLPFPDCDVPPVEDALGCTAFPCDV